MVYSVKLCIPNFNRVKDAFLYNIAFGYLNHSEKSGGKKGEIVEVYSKIKPNVKAQAKRHMWIRLKS